MTSDKTYVTDLLDKDEPILWLFIGDSITAGVKHTYGRRCYVEVLAEHLRWNLKRKRDIFINSGASGNTSEQVLADFNWRVGQFKPTVVSLMIGTNDCDDGIGISIEKFKANVNELVLRIRNMNAIPIINTPNILIPHKDPGRAKLSAYVEELRKIARNGELILIDHNKHWMTIFTGKPEWLTDVLDDAIHPNGKGHVEMAALFCKEVGIVSADLGLGLSEFKS